MNTDIKANLASKKQKSLKPFIKITSGVIIGTIVYLIIDFIGPSTIRLKEKNVFDMPCLHAKDLVVQEYDSEGNLWATRGMIIYKLEEGSHEFKKVAHMPTGLNIYWLRNFTMFRRLTIRPECIEVVVTEKGNICGLSAGKMWFRKTAEKNFKEIFTLKNYGYGNRGIMHAGLIEINDTTVYFGEYFGNLSKKEVTIFKSVNHFNSFESIYKFNPSEIRHIHAIQQDPYTNKLWVCTGDLDEESMLAWSKDGFKSIHKLGEGSPIWRICQLVFTEDGIYWGTDSDSAERSGIYRWAKDSSTLELLQKVRGAIFFATRLADGTIVMSTDREGASNEIDLKTRLYVVSPNNEVSCIECGTWNRRSTVFGSPFAKLRFPRNQGGTSLAITCLNQKEIRDGDLIMIAKDTLLDVAR